MAITPFSEFEGNDAAHAMGKSGSGRVFPVAGKRNPRAGLHGGIEGRSRADGACLPDKHPTRTDRSTRSTMTCAAQSYGATTTRVIHIKRRISSLEFKFLLRE